MVRMSRPSAPMDAATSFTDANLHLDRLLLLSRGEQRQHIAQLEAISLKSCSTYLLTDSHAVHSESVSEIPRLSCAPLRRDVKVIPSWVTGNRCEDASRRRRVMTG
jgi:hypothetical protein